MIDRDLKSIVERIECLEQEQKALGADKRDVYAAAKDAGFNTKALRKVIAERRMKDREEIEAAMHAYRVALGMAINDVMNGATLREAAAKHRVSKSTLHRAVPREKISEVGQPPEDGLEIPLFLRRSVA